MPLQQKTALKRTEFKRSAARLAEPKPAKGEPKPKKCKNRACRQPFAPDPKHPFLVCCSDDCRLVVALAHAAKLKADRQKADRAETKKKLEKFKKKGKWLSEAQDAFNEWVRFRDRNMPCICCGSVDASGAGGVGGGWDAGHWLTRGHASHLRFDPRNVHRQRKGCNRPGGITRAKFRIGLVVRIGEDAVRALEALEYAPTEKRWTVDELKAIKSTYQAKLKELKAQQ